MNQQLRTLPRQEVALPTSFGAMSMTPENLIQRIQDIDMVRQRVMQEDVHYYSLDGDGVEKGKRKYSLGKAGAETLCLAFQLSQEIDSETVVDDPNVVYSFPWKHKEWFNGPNGRDYKWVEDTVTIKGYYEVKATCRVYDAASGIMIAKASGNANSREAAFRNTPTADARNPVLKRAEKRALVAAVLMATASSALFTQDVEDMLGDGDGQGKAGQDGKGGKGSGKGASEDTSTGWLSQAQTKLLFAKGKKLGYSEEIIKHVQESLNRMGRQKGKPYFDGIADEKPEAVQRVWEPAKKALESGAQPPADSSPTSDGPEGAPGAQEPAE